MGGGAALAKSSERSATGFASAAGELTFHFVVGRSRAECIGRPCDAVTKPALAEPVAHIYVDYFDSATQPSNSHFAKGECR
jgi:hypothetical protein